MIWEGGGRTLFTITRTRYVVNNMINSITLFAFLALSLPHNSDFELCVTILSKIHKNARKLMISGGWWSHRCSQLSARALGTIIWAILIHGLRLPPLWLYI